jgi:hypothetical protein
MMNSAYENVRKTATTKQRQQPFASRPRSGRQNFWLQAIVDKHGRKFYVLRKFHLFVARCDKDLSSIFNICQPSVHHRVSSSVIQSNFHYFTAVL